MSYFNAKVGTTAKMHRYLRQGTAISFQRFCKFLASQQTSFGVRLSRIHFTPKDVCGEASKFLVFPQWQYYIFVDSSVKGSC